MCFLTAQSAMLLHAEIHDFHEHNEYCDTFENLEKQSIIIDTPSPLIESVSLNNICPVNSSCEFVEASFSAYNPRAPPA